MTDLSHPALRHIPDAAVSSADPGQIAPEFRDLHRKIGKLTVNRWTYRPLRALGRLMVPPYDKSGVRVEPAPEFGQGAVRLEPETRRGDGALVLFHGGGLVIGSPRSLIPQIAALVRALGVPVIAPAYSLAPQSPAPAALNDCLAAWQTAQAQASALHIDPARLVIGGASAGAGLAAGLAHLLKDAGGPQPAAQLLIYPKLDDRTAARRELDHPRHSVWSNANNRFGWQSYLGMAPGSEDVPDGIVPARREDLSGLPPAWIGVGTCDLFLDEDRAYAERLKAAGVPVRYCEVAGGIHGFDMAQTAITEAFVRDQAAFLAPYVGSDFSQSPTSAAS